MENVKKRNKESNNDNVLKQEDIQPESIGMLDILLVFSCVLFVIFIMLSGIFYIFSENNALKDFTFSIALLIGDVAMFLYILFLQQENNSLQQKIHFLLQENKLLRKQE